MRWSMRPRLKVLHTFLHSDRMQPQQPQQQQIRFCAQAERDGIVVIVREEPGENRAMTLDRAWEIARSIQAFTEGNEFDAIACEAESRRRVLTKHLGCAFDVCICM